MSDWNSNPGSLTGPGPGSAYWAKASEAIGGSRAKPRRRRAELSQRSITRDWPEPPARFVLHLEAGPSGYAVVVDGRVVAAGLTRHAAAAQAATPS